METLDSRLLGTTDCFGQRFSRAGAYTYGLNATPQPCRPLQDEQFGIEVAGNEAPDGEGRQHDVTVRFEGGRLVADPPKLRVAPGDVVLWNAPDTSTPGFAVHGEGEQSFSSASLSNECLFSHAFGVAGDYSWKDANGSGLGGRVVVKDLDPTDPKECERWMAALEEGVVIVVEGDSANPSEVEILTGQTVFWAVAKAPGITVTDERLPVTTQPPIS
jgi:plastocyanin